MSAVRLAASSLKIPKRIERGPTDILKALATTVKHIPKEPETILHDDPYLLPIRPNEKRIYILSKVSGIKTAKFLLNKHPELFFRDDAEPKIEAFMPKEQFNSDMDFTEEDIKWCTENNDVSNAVIAFKSMEEKQIKINHSILLDFFELLCYTNEEQILDSIDYERTKFAHKSEEQLVNETWKTSGLTSKIFNKIKEDIDPPRVYSSMIAGLSLYNEHATARQVFQDFKENHPNTGLYLEAYDGLLKGIPKLCSSTDMATEALGEITKHMEDNLVKPDLLIFNSILLCYRTFACDDNTCKESFKLLNDMKTLNVEPSLFTLSCMIFIIYRYKSAQIYGDMIPDMLNYIQNNEKILCIQDNRDVNSLGTMMKIFAVYMNNLRLANQLHSIYMKNPRLFSDLRYRNSYLNNYFKLIVTAESLDNIMRFYDSYVPMVFHPYDDTYEAFTEVLDLYQAPEEVVKKIGKDLITFKIAPKIKNDAIYRRDEEYVKGLEQLNELKREKEFL